MSEALLVFREGERFATLSPQGRPRIWRVTPTGHLMDVTENKAAGPVAADPAMPEVAPNEETPSTSAREPTP